MSTNDINNLKTSRNEDIVLPDESWMEPSEDVWKGIKEKIPIRKKKNRFPFYLLFIFLVGAMFGLYQLRQTELIKAEPVSQKKDAVLHHKGSTGRKGVFTNGQSESRFNGLAGETDKRIGKRRFVETLNKVQGNGHPVNQIESPKDQKLAYDKVTGFSPADLNDNLSTSQNESGIGLQTKWVQNDGLSKVIVNDGQNLSIMNALPLLSYRQLKDEKALDMPGVTFLVPKTSAPLPMYLGVTISGGLIKSAKENKLIDPLSELVTRSVYDNHRTLGLEMSIPINSTMAITLSPLIRFDQLHTSYALNVPYDMKTETGMGIIKENHFSHSLPTDMGNVKTDLVVTRSSDSPVQHNELISIDFTSRQSFTKLALPIGISYHFDPYYKGFLINAAFIPEFIVSRNLSAETLHSNHSFVNASHANLKLEKPIGDFIFGAQLGVGYQWVIARRVRLQTFTSFTGYLNPYGRNELWNAGVSVNYAL
ncbi:MAG: hypothetical protein IPN29_08255 [Saprospiraceae bacterium]|nr:hypothetical protein [Saprospiraceae bacterium]